MGLRALKPEDIDTIVIGFTSSRATVCDSDNRCSITLEPEVLKELVDKLNENWKAVTDEYEDVLTLLYSYKIGRDDKHE